MVLFHETLLEFLLDQLSLVFSKKISKKLLNTPISSDHIMIADGAVEVDVDIVDKLNIFIHLYGII
jgi:hypothetical protein